ncbi:unnamed protein product, partial [marine sediment metagenome]
MRIDQKYYGDVFKNDGKKVPEEELIIFRAKDRAVPVMLEAYAAECQAIGCSDFHVEGILLLRDRVIHYQQSTGICKISDTYPED